MASAGTDPALNERMVEIPWLLERVGRSQRLTVAALELVK